MWISAVLQMFDPVFTVNWHDQTVKIKLLTLEII